jgi:hypothetical protein
MMSSTARPLTCCNCGLDIGVSVIWIGLKSYHPSCVGINTKDKERITLIENVVDTMIMTDTQLVKAVNDAGRAVSILNERLTSLENIVKKLIETLAERDSD